MSDGYNLPAFEWNPAGDDWQRPERGMPLFRAHPLELVARALAIMEYLASEPANRCEDSDGDWITMGISGAISALVTAGDYEDAGLLLCALEQLVPAEQRVKWAPSTWLEEMQALEKKYGRKAEATP